MSIKVFYHSRDFDGICSAAILYHKYPSEEFRDAEYIGIDYGDLFPWDKITVNDSIVMMDYSLPFHDMLKLREKVQRFCWIDHHRSAIDEMSTDPVLMNNLGGIRDTNFAGCELTWKFFSGTECMPEVVHMLGRYDVWKFDERAKHFQLGMRCLPDSIRNPKDGMWWRLIYGDDGNTDDYFDLVESIVNNGKTVRAFAENNAKFTIENTGMVISYDGIRFLCANACNSSSTLFEFLYDPSKHDAMMSYYFRDGTWRFGLYSTKTDVNILAVAKKFGGGGHPTACGFSVDHKTFTEHFAPALGMK